MLPVFSFREEAEMYLRIEALVGDWQVRKISAGELVSLLHEKCAIVRRVALDPLPGTWADKVVELVVLDCERFVSRVVRGRA
jgi:hypothetical protein